VNSAHDEKSASWREAVRFRALLQVFAWLGLGAALFYVASQATVQFLSPAKIRYAPPDFPWWVEALRGLGAACIALGLGLTITYIFGDVIADYIREIFRATLVDRRFLSRLSDQTRAEITRNTLEIVAPWCAEPLSAFMTNAPHQKRHQTKRLPRHEWEMTNYSAGDRERFELRGGEPETSVHLDPDQYFCIQIHEEAIVDTEFLHKDLTACFFLDSLPGAEEALRKAFFDPSIIYRDLLFLKPADALAVKEFLSQPSQRKNSVARHPISKLIKIKFRLLYTVADPDSEGSAKSEPIEWLPDQVHYEDGLRFCWHRTLMPSAVHNHASGSQVRLQIIHEFPISKDAGFYPIVFGSFSCNPEVIVRFSARDELALKDVFPYLVTADPRAFYVDRNFGNTALRLHSDEHLQGREAWLFPGSGLAVRWRVG
jgi:hypothetical protein